MKFNIIEILVFVSLLQGFLFFVVLQTQKKFKVKANKYLEYSTLILSYIGIVELLVAKGIDKKYYFVDYFGDDIPWLLLFYIPMFVYFLKSAKNSFANSRKLFLLGIPFFIFFIAYLIVDLQLDFELMNWSIVEKNYRALYEIEFYFSIAFNVTLCTVSYFVIKKSRVSFDEQKWLKNIWLFNALLLLTWVINTFIPDEIYPFEHEDITYPVWLGVSIYVYWLIFRGLIQLKLSQDKTEIHDLLEKKEVKKTNPSPNKYLNSTADPKQLHFDNFLQLMDEKKLYRNPDISRDSVASELNVSTGYLSQLISASTSSNFTSLINEYRIKDAKEMLVDPEFDKYSIVAIGLESGFQSKSTFYSAFKKKTGCTPNQFKSMPKES